MYFGGAEDKCFGGRLHLDHATHQIEDYSWANNCFFHLINNHYFSISCAQWHLSIAMHKSTSSQFVILATCHYLYLLIVVVSPWYSCKKWIIVEKDLSNWPFQFHFDKKRVNIGIEVHIDSRHKVLISFRA